MQPPKSFTNKQINRLADLVRESIPNISEEDVMAKVHALVADAPAEVAVAQPASVIRIPVSLRTTTLRHDVPEAVGVITAGDLVQRYEIPRRDFRRKTGYQRDISTGRVNKLAADLQKKRVDLPTALLLNLREYHHETDLMKDGDQVFFCPNGRPLYVVDGQHRIEALARLVKDNPDEWSSFQIAFTCMLGATEAQEMEEFYVVNSTAKSVRTDLALDLLKQRAEADPKIMEALDESGQSWKVEAQGLAEDLAKATLWQGRIRFSGEEKAFTTIGSAGMAGSFQDLLANHYFNMLTRQQRVQILQAYWQGIHDILPEVFADPPNFALQKSTGVQVMHKVLVSVIEYLRSVGKSLLEPASYVQVMKDLVNLEGENGEGEPVRGAEFWQAGSQGAAGGYSSNAGRRVLTAKIKSMLPKPKVE